MRLRDFTKRELEAIAQASGTTYGYLEQLAYGKSRDGKPRRPSPELALKIAEASGGRITFEELIWPRGKPQPALHL
jgi:hypothetical protein